MGIIIGRTGTKFTCFTGTTVQILGATGRMGAIVIVMLMGAIVGKN